MKKLSINKDRIIKMHESGLSVKEIAAKLDVSFPCVYRNLKSKNLGSNKKWLQIRDKAVALYVSGESENAVAKTIGVDRSTIRTCLIKSGVHIRSQSESELLKWSKMNLEQRKNQVKKANETIRNLGKEFHRQSSIKQAKAKEQSLSKVGSLEIEFFNQLQSLGKKGIMQKAVDVYNIDIAIGNTAVEVHANSSIPHNHPYYRGRIKNLLKLGWNVIYIKCTGKVLIERAADKVSQMIDFIESNKPLVSQYGMISGSGQLIATGSLNGDDLSCVKALNGIFAGLERN